MTSIIITKEFIKQFEKDITEKYKVSSGNLKKLVDDTMKMVSVGASKKLTSRIAVKEKLKELNRPAIQKALDTNSASPLAKLWKIVPIVGADGKQYEEIMMLRDFKKAKNAAMSNFKGKRKSMITNSQRLVKVEKLTLEFLK